MTDENWHDSLPDDLKTAPIFKPSDDGTVKSVEQVVADLTNLTQVAGNSLRMPGPDAGADDIATFQARVMEKVPGLMNTPNLEDPESVSAHFTKMGKPATPEEYAVPEIEGFELPNPGEAKSQAHALNMTQVQFTEYVTTQARAMQTSIEMLQGQYDEQAGIIDGEWGAAKGQNRDAVGKFLKENKLCPPEMVEAFDKGHMPANMMRFLLSLSDLGAEGSTFQAQGTGADIIPMPDEAMSQLIEVENRLFSPGMRPGNPEYPLLVARRTKLMTQAYPDSPLDTADIRA